MALDSLRNRFLYRSLDAVLTARLRPRRSFGEHLRSLASPRSSNYERVASFVGLTDRIVPGTGARMSRLLFRPDRLPFAREPELFDYGSGSTVFRMETASGRSVLKVYRRTVGRSRASLARLAGEFRRKYDTVSSFYAGRSDIVAPASFLVVHGPLLRRAAVACLQPYIEEEKHDVFRDFDDEDLLDLMKEHAGFREQFTFFARRTLDVQAEEGSCVDLLGAGNLLAVRDGETWRLRLIDYGIFDLTSMERESRAAFLRLGEVSSRLRSLLLASPPLTEGSAPAAAPDGNRDSP